MSKEQFCGAEDEPHHFAGSTVGKDKGKFFFEWQGTTNSCEWWSSIDMRGLSRPTPAPSTCDFMYSALLYIMVARNINTI
jgi:hypothetical protein